MSLVALKTYDTAHSTKIELKLNSLRSIYSRIVLFRFLGLIGSPNLN